MSNNSGAVTVFVAVIFILLVTAVSVAIDGGRLYLIRAKAQHACDAMALGMAKIAQTNPGFYNNYGNDLQTLVQANFPGSYNGPRYMGSYVGWDAFGGWGNSYDADLEIEVPPLLMQIFGVGNTSVFLQCGVTREVVTPIYVADSGNSRIEVFDINGNYLSQFGSYGSGNGQFIDPYGVAVDPDGNIWVADTFNSRLEKFDANGNYLSQLGSIGSGNGQFFYPTFLTIDASGNLWVSDYYNYRIQEFDRYGNYIMQFGSHGNGNGQFQWIGATAVDNNGHIWVVDAGASTGNQRVQEFDTNGNYISQFGSTQVFGANPSYGPWGIAIDTQNHILVGDSLNQSIDVFDIKGNYLNQIPLTYYWPGMPGGIAIDGSGNIWLAEYNGDHLLRFNSIYNPSGNFGWTGGGNGQLSRPVEIAIGKPILKRLVLTP